MSDVASVTVDAKALIGALDKLSRADFRQALEAGATVIEAAAKQNIIRYDFIDTGATLNSVFPDVISDDEAHIGPTTDYAIYGELGTRYQPAKPFMREAVEQNKAAIEAAVAAAIQDAIRRAL